MLDHPGTVWLQYVQASSSFPHETRGLRHSELSTPFQRAVRSLASTVAEWRNASEIQEDNAQEA